MKRLMRKISLKAMRTAFMMTLVLLSEAIRPLHSHAVTKAMFLDGPRKSQGIWWFLLLEIIALAVFYAMTAGDGSIREWAGCNRLEEDKTPLATVIILAVITLLAGVIVSLSAGYAAVHWWSIIPSIIVICEIVSSRPAKSIAGKIINDCRSRLRAGAI